MRLWSSVDGAPVFVADVPPWHPLARLAEIIEMPHLLAPAVGPLRMGRAWLAAGCLAAGALVALRGSPSSCGRSIAGRPWYALLADHEVAAAFGRAPGRWAQIARVRDVALYALER